MKRNDDFKEYYEWISDENFTEDDRQHALYLWNLLMSIEPFNEDEKKNAEEMMRDLDIDEMLLYSRKCHHMSQEVCDELIDYLDFIFDDELNGFLLDMIVEYFKEN